MAKLPNLKDGPLDNLNLPRMICVHLIGEQHTHVHHMIVGFVIMVFGITVVKLSLLADWSFIHVAGDLSGYAIHGIGLTPFVETIIRNAK